MFQDFLISHKWDWFLLPVLLEVSRSLDNRLCFLDNVYPIIVLFRVSTSLTQKHALNTSPPEPITIPSKEHKKKSLKHTNQSLLSGVPSILTQDSHIEPYTYSTALPPIARETTTKPSILLEYKTKFHIWNPLTKANPFQSFLIPKNNEHPGISHPDLNSNASHFNPFFISSQLSRVASILLKIHSFIQTNH